MQDAWSEVTMEDPSIAKEVHLLNEVRIGHQQPMYSNLPIQPNKGMPEFTELTCNFVVADDEEHSVYFYSHALGAEYCGKFNTKYG